LQWNIIFKTTNRFAMCRYAGVSYKPHYACFACRKSFKRRLLWDVSDDDKATSKDAKCPECGALMANMGLDFEAPKKKEIKEWAHLQTLYSVGITFHSCGCNGPGYIPKSKAALQQYYQEMIAQYEIQLKFWRKRIEPKTEGEIQRDMNKNFQHIHQVPFVQNVKVGAIKNEAAVEFWIGRIREVEGKLKSIH
jgi:DNA-directed RNA polymerase subunit RPC12/RpoP